MNQSEDGRGDLHPGALFLEKYRLERVIGEGGMGVLWAAEHAVTRERVALKFLLPRALAVPELARRFINEARAAVKIRSEHVARVLDAGSASGRPYVVMELLDGCDLEKLMAQGPLKIDLAVDYVLQACEAIAEVHAAGIVHRDLKPANLFLCHRADGSPLIKVLDFGISKVAPEAGEVAPLTCAQGAMGSPLYMSPEQMDTPRDIDARSDIWSLGVVLFHLLTGRWPFSAETLPALGVQIATRNPASLRALRPGCPEGLEAVILRCLEKSRDARFASVAELAWALEAFAPARSRLSVERIAGVLGTPTLPTLDPALTQDVAPPDDSARVERVENIRQSTPSSWDAGLPKPWRVRPGWAAVLGASLAVGAVVSAGKRLVPSEVPAGALLVAKESPPAAGPDLGTRQTERTDAGLPPDARGDTAPGVTSSAPTPVAEHAASPPGSSKGTGWATAARRAVAAHSAPLAPASASLAASPLGTGAPSPAGPRDFGGK